MNSKTVKERKTLNLHSTHPNRMRDSISNAVACPDIEHDSPAKPSVTTITNEQKSVEQKNLMVHILGIINQKLDTEDCIARILLAIKGHSQAEAVGIRIKSGKDYPYYETSGFPEQFVKAEMSLCSVDNDGNIEHDTDGNVLLECMCGNIICGRTDPKFPFFTPNGSFWSNHTTKLLATTSDEDRQARTRNRCNGEGYESVVLIPLKSGNETIGLLQLNDRRKDMFIAEDIEFYEELGNSIGIAIDRKKTQTRLEEASEIINHSSSVAFTWQNKTGWPVNFITKNVERVLGYTEKEFTSGIISYENCIHPDDLQRVGHEVEKFSNDPSRTEFVHEPYRLIRKDGSCRTVKDWTSIVRNNDGEITHYRGIVEDITEHHNAEMDSQKYKEELEIIFDSVPAFIFYKDKENRIIRTNKGLADATGLPREQIEGKTAFEVFLAHAEQYWQDDLEVINSGIPKRNIIEPMIIGDDKFWVQTDKIPYKDSNGDIVGIIGFSRDITEQMRTEDALRQKTVELSKRVKELDCLYSISQLKTDPAISVDEVIQGIVNLIPASSQYPDITCARILLNKTVYTTNNFVESEWKQESDILVLGEIVGKIEVFYTEDRPQLDEGPFLTEEVALIKALGESVGLYAERKRAKEQLHATNLKLMVESQSLQESNIAMKEVLASIESSKKENLLRIQSNIDKIMMPLVKKLQAGANDTQISYLNLLDTNLRDMTSPFIGKLEIQFASLSPREVEICKMLMNGMTSKEIATALNTSVGTVFNQRKTIRKKLGISSDNINLVSFLKTI